MTSQPSHQPRSNSRRQHNTTQLHTHCPATMQRHPRSRQQPTPTTSPRRGGTSALLTTGSLLLFLSCSWTLTSCQAEAAANSLVLPQDEPQQQKQHQSAGSAIRDLFYRVSPEDMWDWLNGGNGNSGGGGQGGGGDGGGDGGTYGGIGRSTDILKGETRTHTLTLSSLPTFSCVGSPRPHRR